MAQDLTQVILKIQGELNKIGGILPGKWKGNLPPATSHFDPDSIKVSTQVDAKAQKAFFAFDFTDGPSAHRLECDLKVAPDLKSVSWEALLDGKDCGEAHIALVPKIGLEGFSFYERIAVEVTAPGLPGAEHQIRFDGDLDS